MDEFKTDRHKHLTVVVKEVLGKPSIPNTSGIRVRYLFNQFND